MQWADVTLAAGHAPVLRTVKPHVFVTIGIEDLIDPATGPAAGTMGFGAQISAARARWLGCDGRSAGSSWAPTAGSWTTAARPLRRGPPRACERWGAEWSFHSPAAGHPPTGVTSIIFSSGTPMRAKPRLENSALLCERHHTKAHHGFRVERDPDGRWHTYRPDGTEILIPVPLRT